METLIEQSTRLLSMVSPLGEDALVLQGFSGSETLSTLFSYQLEMVTELESIEPEDIVGKNVTVCVTRSGGGQRYFNGFISRFSGLGQHSRGLRRFTAELVPWPWFLTRTQDCRIFQNKSVPKILEEVFSDLGFKDFKMNLQDEHPAREYCVQYRETTFDFVSRLLEEEGIFYWFRHENGKHIMMLADHEIAYDDCPEQSLSYMPDALQGDHITAWEHQYRFRSGKFAQTDYDFEKPSASLATQTNTLVKLPKVSNYEIYDYPGGYSVRNKGEALTKLRMEAEEVAHNVVECSSSYRTLFAGGKFKVKRHECHAEVGASYVITSIHHNAVDHTHVSGGGESYYSNSFECIPDKITFRPARTTPRPIVRGLQTAVVVGPKGEEIYTDKYGRVKVQFHWDRVGKFDENSSCWMRVAQVWAGKKWGAMYIPRVGQEVIVDFLEGNPDAPIVTGRVYNGESMPPYDLPANKTVSTLKSSSCKNASGFNEIGFDDKKGEERFFMHAEKDQSIDVKNDRFETVGNDRHLAVKANKFEHVEKSSTELVDADRKLTVKGAETKAVDGTCSLTAKGDVTETFKANHTEKTSGDYSLKASDIVLEANSKITLKVGGSSITIGPSGIELNSSASIKVAGKGMVKVESSGIVAVQGSMVKLN